MAGNNNTHKYSLFFFVLCLFFFMGQGVFPALAQEQTESAELNGDIVEYSVDGNRVNAEGNVEIQFKDTTLKCDKLEFFRDTQMAKARGNVTLMTKTGEISGDSLNFNFKTMTGDFNNARILSQPMYGAGERISKVSKDLIMVEKGFMTTCDYDKPHYRLASKRMDVFPGDKVVAKNVRLMFGKIPVLYIPRYTQSLKDKKPWLIMTPGYDKDWGMFLLSQIRYFKNENFKGTLHLDAREKKDIASGFDLDYKTADWGEGIIKTYYMNERSITSKRFYEPRPSPTIEKERFKVEWRHKWEIDNKTRAIAQYYKLSDPTILKDYFEREYEEDGSPKTYFLLTRNTQAGVLSFRTDARVNRFESAVERLPEVQYNLTSREIANTGFYFTNRTTYSNLVKKTASPSEVRQQTMRLDTDGQLSYPMKLGFIELNPSVGGSQTYYSKTKDPDKYNSIRGQFRTGASVSTKFFRIFDVDYEEYGFDIHRLRHIITPSVGYSYVHAPTLSSEYLDYFDGIESKSSGHSLTFTLENKLQTKTKKEETVDLVRSTISVPFNLKESEGKGGFGNIETDMDIKPVNWLTLYFDSTYDTRRDHLQTANFDLYINDPKDQWKLSLGKRWNREVDDQLTSSLEYRINPKWSIEVLERFDLERGLQKEQQIILTRDLHAWKMDLMFNETRGEGDEIMMVFTLKAFPEIGIDAGSSFNKRKPGSQSN